jgi:hypothetical protein
MNLLFSQEEVFQHPVVVVTHHILTVSLVVGLVIESFCIHFYLNPILLLGVLVLFDLQFLFSVAVALRLQVLVHERVTVVHNY